VKEAASLVIREFWEQKKGNKIRTEGFKVAGSPSPEEKSQKKKKSDRRNVHGILGCQRNVKKGG